MVLLKRLIAIAGVSLMLGACSVGMAISGKEDPDLRAVKKGATRSGVEAQLGRPVKTVSLADDAKADVYAYAIGNEPSVARAFGHAIVDLVTLGIWELAGTSIERSHEEKYYLAVYYDASDSVIAVKPVRDPDMIMAEAGANTANADDDAATAGAAPVAVSALQKTPETDTAAPSAPSTMETPETPPQAKAPASSGPVAEGRYRIQLASLRSRAGAEREWVRLQARWPEVFGTRESVIEKKDIARRGTFFRVQTSGFETLADARAMCAILHAGKQACFPVKR